jgi:hypothetical protein
MFVSITMIGLLTKEDSNNDCSLTTESLKGTTASRPFDLEIGYGAREAKVRQGECAGYEA